MNDVVVRVDGLSKAFRLGVANQKSETLIGEAFNLLKAPARNFRRLKNLNTFGHQLDTPDILWALKDVSFSISRGEVVGFVGRNGAGKSTLLKILSRISEPTSGRVEIKGRVSSLLEVGTGFHQELTGRENVFMNGSILGMARGEIARKFDEIVAFSGVERFLDTPIKRYSSGMKVRLAFAVAAHLEPEIFIIDEVLAVGDAEFQSKCLGKMHDLAGGGRTVLFVSHNMGAIQNLCPRSIYLRNGTVVGDGESGTIIQDYLQRLNPANTNPFSQDNPERKTSGQVRLMDGCLLDSHGQSNSNFIAGQQLSLVLKYHSSIPALAMKVVGYIYNPQGVRVHRLDPAFDNQYIYTSTFGTLRCTVPRLALPPGRYRIALSVSVDGATSDVIPNALAFDVIGCNFHRGTVPVDPNYGVALTDQEWVHDAQPE